MGRIQVASGAWVLLQIKSRKKISLETARKKVRFPKKMDFFLLIN